MLGESSQQFDSEGNLTKLVDPNGNVSTFAYNQVGQLLEETSPIGTKSYKYNSQDLLEEMTNGRGDKRTLRYDLLGRITEFEDADGKVTYKYDNNNNVIEVTSKEGTVKREFDALNRVIKHVDTRGNVIGYQYNEVGSLSKLIYPDGKFVTYVYNGAEMLEKVTDWAGRVTLYEYDKNGRLSKTKRSNGTVEETQFDKAGRILSRIDKTSDGKEINTFVYEYDNSGKVTVEKGIANPNVPSIKNVKMEYAPGNKLISYNGKEVKYDGDGNMIYGPLNDEMVTFVYDSRNRLVKAGNTTYTYDGENTRVSVTESGKTTTYITDPNARLSRILAKQTSDGKQIFYVYGNGLIGQEEAGKFKAYHYDLRGSTTKVTDETGKITDTIAYGPYGELLSKEGTTDLEFLYNGRDGVQTDSNGLYYMRARYYNTDIKRFINQDILIGSITNGKSLNRYAYVHGDPVSLVDPFGLAPNPLGVVSTYAHLGLAIIGMMPGLLGMGADILNATIYFFEGDHLSAAQSAVAIAIPFVPTDLKSIAYVTGAALDFEQAKRSYKDGNMLSFLLNAANGVFKLNNAANYAPGGKWSNDGKLDDYNKNIDLDDYQNQKNSSFDVDGNYTGGRTLEELDELANDSAKGGITDGGRIEAKVILDLERNGAVGRVERSLDPRADYIDTSNGNKIDIKSFESNPIGSDGKLITNPKKGAFKVDIAMRKIINEFERNGNDIVVLNTLKLKPEHIDELKTAIDSSGLSSRIIWWP